MENVLTFLKQLELSEIEANLYLTLLKNGPTSVRELAETIEIKRTTAYFYIDQLVEKGLAMKLVKSSRKLVAANHPETLQHLVEEKVASAKRVEQSYPAILKTLTTSLPQNTDTGEAEVKYYKGKNGVKKIYEDALTANEIRSYVNLSAIATVFPENFKVFDDAFKRNPTLEIFEIVEHSPSSEKRTQGSNKMHYHKILPKDMSLTAQDILIYEGRVGIINLKDDIHGVILKNTDLYNNLKLLFDFIWKILPEE